MSSFNKFRYQNPLLKRFGEPFFKDLPEKPGVYFFLDQKEEPLYIGKADNLRKRLMSYRLAKPGSSAEHTLEMIDRAWRIRWELHPTGKDALLRESELLHAVRPPFNIAGTDPAHYLMIGLRFDGDAKAEFRLSHREIEKGFKVFGCFKHRGKVKFGYTALLRLLHASVVEEERFHFPAKICQSAPPYVYTSRIPPEWKIPLVKFLKGQSPSLLQLMIFRLLEKENIQPFMYAGFQKDLETAATFFRLGPQATRKIARKLGLKNHFVSESRMNASIYDDYQNRA